MQFVKILLLPALLSFSPASARADATPGFFAGAGIHSANLLKTSSDGSGGRSILGAVYFPELSFGYRFGQWFPLFGYSLFGKSLAEGQKRQGFLRLQMPYVFSPLGSVWDWKAGPGIMLHRIYGKGGTATLENGAGRQTYYVPEDDSNARTLYLMGGVGLQSGRLRYDLDLLLSGILSVRRSFSLSAGAGYVF